ncbi:SDR family oxidoreductase (plasmid) [Agrobacterium sp. rho-13.3]|uniref:SDR family oxidoreductase n=1 Tax=Agrobacterium sp. rho-13.3 TaxID=3072980 RepID=UPI002A112B57|nr:SDR family oxidoreductase [Agrobacterium sp. rho-13.3]MDX8311899.1 SDR family oxidoreductase [Agrobacterium sp. rho-13.3]
MTQSQTPTSFGNASDGSSAETNLKVFVVGATGFLGAKILRNLAQDENATVLAMSRKGAPSGNVARVEWVRGDMMDPASLDRALQGVDVVVSSANSYMKGSLDTDFQGNKNLIEAAARAKVSRFVFLSIVSCEAASKVPHFHAKKVAEDLIKTSSVPYVFVRAPSFLDQSTDYIAKAVKGGKFQGMGDKTTRWSYVLTDDLAVYLAKAATYRGSEIVNQTIDVGWSDGPKNQQELADIISSVINKRLKVQIIPWWVLRVAARPVKLFSELGYDLIQMFLFFKTGLYVSNTAKQERFVGPAPTALDAITRWARDQQLIP